METIRESTIVAVPPHEELPRDATGLTPEPAIEPRRPERELALQIRMTASSLIGIALMERNPVPESTRA